MDIVLYIVVGCVCFLAGRVSAPKEVEEWDAAAELDKILEPYFVNESGLKVDAATGDLVKE